MQVLAISAACAWIAISMLSNASAARLSRPPSSASPHSRPGLRSMGLVRVQLVLFLFVLNLTGTLGHRTAPYSSEDYLLVSW